MSAQSNTQGFVYAGVSLRHGTRTSRRSISSRPRPSSAILPTNGYRSGEPLSKATLYLHSSGVHQINNLMVGTRN